MAASHPLARVTASGPSSPSLAASAAAAAAQVTHLATDSRHIAAAAGSWRVELGQISAPPPALEGGEAPAEEVERVYAWFCRERDDVSHSHAYMLRAELEDETKVSKRLLHAHVC